MRRDAIQTARAASKALRGETLNLRQPLIPFVCANCRRAALQPTRAQRTPPNRTFASTSIPRQQAAAAPSPQQQPESPLPQTHYDFFPLTFPSGPPPNSPFPIELKTLRKEFLQLQAKAHPDLHLGGRKRQAEALSSRINEAYKTLQDPLKQAQYLLSLQGIDVEDESAKLEGSDSGGSSAELLMEVMEAREAVEEVEDEEQLVAVRVENDGRVDESVDIMAKAFACRDWEAAAREAVRLRYWVNIRESIEGWEKGQGGGMNHH
ncbi:hypothetical protein LTR08_000490 [Meristemomyces frigidus]|nr:hypothetical protein LTR08_000490 [Meristemomyces frigidus]